MFKANISKIKNICDFPVKNTDTIYHIINFDKLAMSFKILPKIVIIKNTIIKTEINYVL